MGNKAKILLVDDDADVLEYLEAILSDHFEVTACSKPSEALSEYKKCKPDILVSDYQMPEFTGIDLMEAIKEFDEDLTCILLTGKGDKSTAISAIHHGAFDYLEKPTSAVNLVFAVDRAVDSRKVLQEKLLAQQASVQSEKLASIGMMTACLAHEIATPLMIIEKKASQILKDPDPAAQKDKVDTIANMVGRIGTLVQSLKNVSRSQEEKAHDVSIDEILTETKSLCSLVTMKYSVDFSVAEPTEKLGIHGQHVETTQVLLNLVTNACQAVQDLDERWVRLSVESDGEFVLFRIADSGKGIPEDQAGKIFETFYTSKPVGEGTGLGLSTSKLLAESNGGSLTIDHSKPNTCFVLKLPKAKKPLLQIAS